MHNIILRVTDNKIVQNKKNEQFLAILQNIISIRKLKLAVGKKKKSQRRNTN